MAPNMKEYLDAPDRRSNYRVIVVLKIAIENCYIAQQINTFVFIGTFLKEHLG